MVVYKIQRVCLYSWNIWMGWVHSSFLMCIFEILLFHLTISKQWTLAFSSICLSKSSSQTAVNLHLHLEYFLKGRKITFLFSPLRIWDLERRLCILWQPSSIFKWTLFCMDSLYCTFYVKQTDTLLGQTKVNNHNYLHYLIRHHLSFRVRCTTEYPDTEQCRRTKFAGVVDRYWKALTIFTPITLYIVTSKVIFLFSIRQSGNPGFVYHL